MENNQPTSELATSLLLELYKDYKKEKKRALIYKIVYYILVFSIFVWVLNSASSLTDKAQEKKTAPIEEHIAVVKIKGAIMPEQDAGFENLSQLLTKAFEHERSLGVVLDIDSPGGSVYESDIIIQLIEKLKEKYPNKKVISHARMLAASAAYAIALCGEKIYAQTNSSTIGSIGTRMSTFNFYDLITEHKIKYIDIHAGKHKTDLDPFGPINPEALVFYQEQANLSYQEFVDYVKERRGVRLKPTDDTFSGRAWRAVESLEMGLIDGIKPFEDVIKEEYGEYPCRIVEHPQEMNIRALIKDSLTSFSNSLAGLFISSAQRGYYA